MRYLLNLVFVLALAVMGCSETSGTGASGGDGGTGGGMAACVDFVCPCTEAGIRAAIEQGGGPFTFDCDGSQTVLTDDEIIIDNDVVLDGESNLTVDGSFTVAGEVTAELRRFTVTGGGLFLVGIGDQPRVEGCISNNGTLTLTDTSVTENDVGILNEGTLTLMNSTVSDNAFCGIFLSDGTLSLTNSTVSGNGGEPLCDGITIGGGTLALVNTTISDNVLVRQTPPPGTTIVSTATLIDGACGTDEGIAMNWTSTSNGYNIESPGDTCGFDQSTDQVEVTVEQLNLGPLQDNGGPTQTHALRLLPTPSVAIDVIPAVDCVDAEGAPLTTDQRGEPRPETGGDACDVGAFERQPGDQ